MLKRGDAATLIESGGAINVVVKYTCYTPFSKRNMVVIIMMIMMMLMIMVIMIDD